MTTQSSSSHLKTVLFKRECIRCVFRNYCLNDTLLEKFAPYRMNYGDKIDINLLSSL